MHYFFHTERGLMLPPRARSTSDVRRRSLSPTLCGAKSGKVMVMRRRLTTMRESISSTHRYQVSDNAARTSDHGFRRHARAASWIMRACIIAV